MATPYKEREPLMLAQLHPKLRPLCEAFLAKLRADKSIPADIEFRLTDAYRSNARQAELYAKGRTTPGKTVTNTPPGKSKHNHTLKDGTPASAAFDATPFRNGQPVYTTTGSDGKVWQKMGEVGEALGLTWGYRWVKLRDYPHFELKDGTY